MAPKKSSSFADDKAIKKMKDALKLLKKEMDTFAKDATKSFDNVGKSVDKSIKQVNLLSAAVAKLGKQVAGVGSINLGGGNSGNGNRPPPVSPPGGRPPSGAGRGGGGSGGNNQQQGWGFGPARMGAGASYGLQTPWGSQTTAYNMSIAGNTMGAIANSIQGMQLGGLKGVGDLSGVRNQKIDQIMNYDLSSVFGVGKSVNQAGSKERFNRKDDAEQDFTKYLKDKFPDVMSGAVEDGLQNALQLKKQVGSGIVSDREQLITKAGSPMGGLPSKIATFIDPAMQTVGGMSTGSIGGKQIQDITTGVLEVNKRFMNYQDKVFEAQTMTEKDRLEQQVDGGTLKVQQNLVNRSGMMLPAQLRTGNAMKMLGIGQRSGMSSGEAAQYGTGVFDQFGSGMGNQLAGFGSQARAKLGGNAGGFASMAGMAGMGSGSSEYSNDGRASKGLDILRRALADGVKAGLKDPQSMEAFAQPIAEAIRQSGGRGGFMGGYLLNGINSDNANPEVLRQRAGALGQVSAGEQSNPYLRSSGLAGARNALGADASYVSTQALGGSLQSLVTGGREMDALGITAGQRSQALTDRMRSLLSTATAGGGKESAELKSYVASQGGDVLSILKNPAMREKAAAVVKGTVGGLDDFTSTANFFEGIGGALTGQGLGGSRLDLDKMKTKGGSFMAAEQTKTAIDIKAFSEALTRPGLQENLSAMVKSLNGLLSLDANAEKGEIATKAFEAIEKIFKEISEDKVRLMERAAAALNGRPAAREGKK